MCETLAGLREAITAFGAAFDPALVLACDAGRVVDDAAAIEAVAATIKSLAAARLADSGAWRGGGERSPAHHLARRTGVSVGAAVDALETARRLEELPATAAAARRGELSAPQASAIAGAASADPGAEARLLEASAHSSLAGLRDECARTRAAALGDAEARRRRIHAERRLRTHLDAGGGWNLAMRDNPEVGALIMAALAPLADEVFRAARVEGRHERPEAYLADALAELARRQGVAGDGGTGDGGTGDGGTGDGGTGDDRTGDGGTGDDRTGDGGTGDDRTGDGGSGDGAPTMAPQGRATSLAPPPAPGGSPPPAPGRPPPPPPPARPGGLGAAPRSWSVSTWTPCCGATPARARCASSSGSARWPCRPCAT